ncbi:MAG: thioesterase family protein [Acidimicrobiales bacterium]|nr:thioesterase family protein [Acidimicrobiales bacterium]
MSPDPARPELEQFVGALDLDAGADGEWHGTNTGEGHGVIFGGQLLAQTIVAAARTHDDKQVRSVQTVFARAGSTDTGVQLVVDPMHAGRSFASVAVSAVQGDRLCCRSIVLLDQPDDDLVRHEVPMPGVGSPPTDADDRWWQIETVGGVDLMAADVGPAELQVWSRFPGLPGDEVTGRAALAYASDGFLIGTAMRPHEGIDQSMAHQSVATTVLSHTISFHEPIDASGWLLLTQESTYAGHGRAYGRATVHAADGRHVASFVQDAMLRAVAPDRRN